MRKVLWLLAGCFALSACVTPRPAPPPAPAPWDQRVSQLQAATTWQLDGRAAVAVGSQGWQATLNWSQRPDSTDVHLSGPLGIGALALERTSRGLSVNGAPASDAVLAQLQERLGFDLPLDELRFWLLGIPDPGAPFQLSRNAQDRALELTQAGWTVSYDRYSTIAGDLLPGHLVVSREGVRVKIAVDHWSGIK
jgi:outer membrane lipoprotein LolB